MGMSHVAFISVHFHCHHSNLNHYHPSLGQLCADLVGLLDSVLSHRSGVLPRIASSNVLLLLTLTHSLRLSDLVIFCFLPCLLWFSHIVFLALYQHFWPFTYFRSLCLFLFPCVISCPSSQFFTSLGFSY